MLRTVSLLGLANLTLSLACSGGAATVTGGQSAGGGTGANASGGQLSTAIGGASSGQAGESGGGNQSVGGAASSGAASGGAASGGAASGGGAGGSMLACRDAEGQLLPEIKDCSTDADCFSVPTFSCCGAGEIVGVAKKASQYLGCFPTQRPANCAPLGCAGIVSSEEGLQGSGALGTPDTIVVRCYDIAGGRKACMTTVSGSCVHNVTRCAAGETCTNECDEACSCQDGYMRCARPTNGSACAAPPKACAYPATPGASTVGSCSCQSPESVWTCSN